MLIVLLKKKQCLIRSRLIFELMLIFRYLEFSKIVNGIYEGILNNGSFQGRDEHYY